MNAAQVATSTKKRLSPVEEGNGVLEPQASPVMNLQPSALEKYPWPEDFF